MFCSPEAISEKEIKECLDEMFETDIPKEDIQTCISDLLRKYDDERYPFSVVHLGGGFQFLTKPAYQASISILLKQKSKKRLSASALETLAIIAYRQPVTKSQLEQIRGVNCDYAVQKLLEKELIEIKGKSDAAGKPVLYGTSEKFMDYFGINSLSDLPQLKDIASEENSIGPADSGI